MSTDKKNCGNAYLHIMSSLSTIFITAFSYLKMIKKIHHSCQLWSKLTKKFIIKYIKCGPMSLSITHNQDFRDVFDYHYKAPVHVL